MVKTEIGVTDRGHRNSLMANVPLAKNTTDGSRVLEAAVLLENPPEGKMLVPYWIWDTAPRLLPARVRGWFYDVVQEKLMQHWTWGLRAHYTSDESYDTALQDKLWTWTAEHVGAST